MVWRVSSDWRRNVSRATSAPTAVDEVVEQHEVAGPLRQPHRLAAAHERHELAEDDLELVGLVAERLHAGLQARDVAVVVGAPDVDEQLVAAGELVAVVGDVREQVGGLAVGLHEDAVLVVAEVGGAQPHGAVLLEDHAVVAQVLRAWRRSRRDSARLFSLNHVSKRDADRAPRLVAQVAASPSRSPTPSGRRRRASRPPTRGCTRPRSRPRAGRSPSLAGGQRRGEQVASARRGRSGSTRGARRSRMRSRIRHSESPKAAHRPPPAWSGPVGLADTNSTLTLLPPPRSSRA